MADHITIIAFDLGGMLVDVNKSAASVELGLPDSLVQQVFFNTPLFESFTLGKISARDYFDYASTHLKQRPFEVQCAFEKMLSTRPYCEHLLESLKSPFTIWSNINVCHYKHILKTTSILASRSMTSCLSFDLGYAKPDRAFYEACLEKNCAHPSQVVFFDDKAENILAANKLGIRGHIVKTESQILSELKLLHLI